MTRKAEDRSVARAKVHLGKAIVRCRGTKWSQRQLAMAIGLAPSNLKYIEDGVNASTAEVYTRLMETLKPPPEMRSRMDRLYMTIRQAPPPDVCAVFANNPGLLDLFRTMENKQLSTEQQQQLTHLFASFSTPEPDAQPDTDPPDTSPQNLPTTDTEEAQ